jgi:hypothetical protein
MEVGNNGRTSNSICNTSIAFKLKKFSSFHTDIYQCENFILICLMQYL